MKKLDFLREYFKNMRTVGTVVRSSKHLCSKIVSLSDLSGAKCVVELGAGDGVMTHHILEKMPADAKLFAFEINPTFCERLRLIDDERLFVIEDSAENLELHLENHGFAEVDTVFSAIPFVMLPKELSNSIVSTCHRALKPLGQYLQIHYSTIEKDLYKGIFGNLNITFHLRNIPPTFIFACYKMAF